MTTQATSGNSSNPALTAMIEKLTEMVEGSTRDHEGNALQSLVSQKEDTASHPTDSPSREAESNATSSVSTPLPSQNITISGIATTTASEVSQPEGPVHQVVINLPTILESAGLPQANVVVKTVPQSESMANAGHAVVTVYNPSSNAAPSSGEESTKNMYKCTKCDYSSHNKHYLKQHVYLVHSTERPFKCPLCDYAGKRSHSLKEHLVVHSPYRPYTCSFCNASFRKKAHLTNHAKLHASVATAKCGLCGSVLSNMHDLSCHLREAHSKDNVHKCDHCDFATISIGELIAHIQHHGLRPKLYCCRSCKFIAMQETDVSKHIMMDHSGSGSYDVTEGMVIPEVPPITVLKCFACTFSTTSESDLKEHMKEHVETVPIANLQDDAAQQGSSGEDDAINTCRKAAKLDEPENDDSDAASVNPAGPFSRDKLTGVYTCIICGYTCDHQRTIKAHVWRHSGHKSLDYPIFQNGPLSMYDTADGSVSKMYKNSTVLENKVKVTPVSHPAPLAADSNSSTQLASASVPSSTGSTSKVSQHNVVQCTTDDGPQQIQPIKILQVPRRDHMVDVSKSKLLIQVAHRKPTPTAAPSVAGSIPSPKSSSAPKRLTVVNTTAGTPLTTLLSSLKQVAPTDHNIVSQAKLRSIKPKPEVPHNLEKKKPIECANTGNQSANDVDPSGQSVKLEIDPTGPVNQAESQSSAGLAGKAEGSSLLVISEKASMPNNSEACPDMKVAVQQQRKRMLPSSDCHVHSSISKRQKNADQNTDVHADENKTDDGGLKEVTATSVCQAPGQVKSEPPPLSRECENAAISDTSDTESSDTILEAPSLSNPDSDLMIVTSDEVSLYPSHEVEVETDMADSEIESDNQNMLDYVELEVTPSEKVEHKKDPGEANICCTNENEQCFVSLRSLLEKSDSGVPNKKEREKIKSVDSSISEKKCFVSLRSLLEKSDSEASEVPGKKEREKIKTVDSGISEKTKPSQHGQEQGISSSLLAAIEHFHKEIRSDPSSGILHSPPATSVDNTSESAASIFECISPSSGQLRCKLCHYTNSSLNGIKSHMRLHKAKKPKECSLCSFVGDDSQALQQHMLLHCKLRTYSCKSCGSSFSCKSQLRAHMRAHSSIPDLKERILSHVCGLCQGKFPTTEKLIRHKEGCISKVSTSLRCPECSFISMNRELFNKHMHCHGKIYKCELCEYTTKNYCKMQNHLKGHIEPQDLHCAMCDFVATSIRSLKSHMKRHTNDQRFVQQPLEQYKCNLCGYICHHLPALKSHMWRHSTETDYDYEVTNGIINAAIELDTQSSQMTQAPGSAEADGSLVAFRCCHCFFETNSKSLLNDHMKVHHDIIQKTLEVNNGILRKETST